MSTTFNDAATLRLTHLARASSPAHQLSSCGLFARPWPALRRWAERRSQRKALGELAGQAHLLNDIGLTRAQALREAAKPFWLP